MSPNPEPTGARWQRRSEERPGELIAAALDLFTERGFAATRTEEIARRAGVTIGTLYRYFDSKEALFAAAVEQAMARPVAGETVDGAAWVAAFPGSSADLFRVFMREWWAMASHADYARAMKLVIAESANFPDVAELVVSRVVQPGQALCAQMLRRGIDRGEFRPIDVEAASRVLASTISFAAIYRQTLQPHDPRPFDAEQYVDTAIALFLSGLLVAPEAP